MAPAKRRPVSSPEKQRIVDLHKDGKSTCDIVDLVGRSSSVVKRIVAKFKTSGSIESSPRTGRPRKTSPRDDRVMARMSLENRFKTAAEISRNLSSTSDIKVSRQTVSRRLRDSGLLARVPAKKPLISKKNQKARLAFANEHVVWTSDKWSRVHFSDESKYNVIGSDGQRYVRRRTGERLSIRCVQKTVKFGGGSVMVWGIMSASGCGPLVRLQGSVNAEVYKQLLRQYTIPYFQSAPLKPPIFMHDNAPCHTAKKVKAFLLENRVQVMDWPAQSPDLNPIENIWKVVGDRARTHDPKNQEELWQALQTEWNKITPSFCKKLIDSCGKRCQEVINSIGLFTKY